MTILDHALYAALWLSFGAGHSWLAGDRPKAAMARVFGRGQRLAYNAIAVVHIAAVLIIGRFVLAPHAAPFDLPAWTGPAAWALQAAGLVVVIAALSAYDLGAIAGTKQLRGGAGPDPQTDVEPLRTTGLNRWVRHPLYSGSILVLIGLATTPFGAATAVWGAAYFVIGARFEERRLTRLYGEAYERYRARVPAFVPWRGRPA